MTCKAVLILAFSLFVVCLGEPECGKNQCKDLWTAKKCNKVKYCIEEEWSKLKPTGNTDNVCEICLRMVKEARDTLRSNETRTELLEVFEGSCKLLYLKPAVELCDNLVDQFVPELVAILSSQMDPETVCSVAKLCNNEVFAAALKNSKACLYCESFTEALANQMENLSPEQFKNGIISLCRTAGSFSDACYYISSIYSDTFYNNSLSILNKKPCEATSLCPSGPLYPQSIVKIKKKMCPLCRNVMTSLKKQLLNVNSAEEFTESMFKVCEKFNFPYNTCLKISTPALYEKLKNNDTPNLLCRMTFCNNKTDDFGTFWPLVPSDNESFSLTRELEPLELLDNFEMFFPDTKHEKPVIRTTTEAARPTIAYGDPIDDPVFLAPVLGVPTFKDCKTCSHVLGKLESGNFKKGNSEDMFRSVCDKAENVEMCKEFVNSFSHILTKAFTGGFASRKMCEDLIPSCVIKREETNTESSSDSTCSLCLNSVKTLKHIEPAYWKEIEEQCTDLPDTSRHMCSIMFSNLPAMFRNYNEGEICKNMKLCESSVTNLNNATEVFIGGGLKKSELCKTCISTLEEIVDFAKNNKSDIVIRVLLESVCYMLPPEDRKICAHMIEIVGVEKIIKIIKDLNPVETCSRFHICKREKMTAPEIFHKISSDKEGNEKIPCKFCLMAIKTLLDDLQDDRTEEGIRKALERLCNYFPEETRDTCRNLIEEYTEDLIDMIIADFNANEICMYLKMCPHPNTPSISVAAEASNRNDYVVFDIQTNQVLDWNEKPTLASHTEKPVEEPKREDLERFHEYVKECAMCEALVGVINSHSKMLDKTYDFIANAEYICSIVPENDKGKNNNVIADNSNVEAMCKSLLTAYGPSMVNLLVDKKVDINEVCVYIDLCDRRMQAKVNQPVSVPESKFIPEENECAKGPRFWCANAENAERCGTFLHCQETVWKYWENPPKRPTAH